MSKRGASTITTHVEGNAAVISILGRLNLDSRGLNEFRGEIRRLLRSGVRRFVLDLKYVKTIDSSGVGELVAAHTRITQCGGELSLVNLPPRLKSVLEITKFTSWWD